MIEYIRRLRINLDDKSEGFLAGYSYGFAFAVLMFSGLAVLYGVLGTDVR
jgi:hypothetical protein